MKLEERMARLEAALAEAEEKRKHLLIDHLALCAAFIAISSTAQHAEVKSKAMETLMAELQLAEYSAVETAKATEALESLFCALDVARTEADQTPARLS